MSIAVKALLSIVLLAVAGLGAVYFLRVENKVQVEVPSLGAPSDKTRQELAAQYRHKAGTQNDLKSLNWDATTKK